MTSSRGPVEKDDLQAWIDGRLPPERAEAVYTYLAEHPEVRARLSQYVRQREALRAAFAALALAGGPIPTRLRIAQLTAEKRRRRHRQLAQIAAAVAFLALGGVGGW